MVSSEVKTKKSTAKKKAVKKPTEKSTSKKAPAKKAARKKSSKVKEIKLSESQKSFIENKVKSLGTIEKVRSFYSLDDNVCKYAIGKAEEMFGK